MTGIAISEPMGTLVAVPLFLEYASLLADNYAITFKF
jgi:hypothetical protein